MVSSTEGKDGMPSNPSRDCPEQIDDLKMSVADISPTMPHSKSAPAFDTLADFQELDDEEDQSTVRCFWLPKWVPSSGSDLANAEQKLLRLVKADITNKFVSACSSQVWTATLKTADLPPPPETAMPLVLVHGFAGGLGLFVHNLDPLCRGRTVYAFDLLGFGRSGRPKFPTDPSAVETVWVESFEQWRQAMGLEQMILLGHSLGAFLAASYAIRYPARVRHLIMADAWGLPAKPNDDEQGQNANGHNGEMTPKRKVPRWVRTMAPILTQFNPLATVRAVGPLGPRLVRKVRPDLGKRYGKECVNPDAIFDYIYHCNAQKPSGETAFRQLVYGMGFARRPIGKRMTQNIDISVPISFLYGDETFMDIQAGRAVQQQRQNMGAYATLELVDQAGHQIFADNPEHFNRLVVNICNLVDHGSDK